MLLSELTHDLPVTITHDPDITHLTCDSRTATPNSLFFDITGQYGKDSKAAYVIDPTHCDNIQNVIGDIAKRFYQHSYNINAYPKLIGITGTNGKTSVAHFVRELLTKSGKKAASIGTLGVIGANIEKAGTATHTLTTPDILYLHETLAQLAAQHYDYVALEVSSHGLHQQRIAGLTCEVAALTNITQDHLDYHGTMQEYVAAKQLLFTNYLMGKAIVHDSCKKYATGTYYQLQGLKTNHHGIAFEYDGKTIQTQLMGAFQAENIVCALHICEALGIDQSTLLQHATTLTPVRGRMEKIATHNDATILVDYAHTPDALATILQHLRPHITNAGRLMVVFGAGGDRDKTKRPLMGEIAAQYADFAIITDDNPRTEDANLIRDEIAQKCPTCLNIEDRATAITHALSLLQPHDILVIAGKGHEEIQVIGTEALPYSDTQVVLDYCNTKQTA